MPILLHPRCKERLVETLTEALPQIVVKNGMFLDGTSCWDALSAVERVIPTEGKLRDQLVSYLDDRPIFAFVADSLSLKLLELDRYQPDKPAQNLTDVEGFGDPDDTARLLVSELESLPWRYAFSISLPLELSKALAPLLAEPYVLSPNIRLLCPDEDFDKTFPFSTSNEKLRKRVYRPKGLLFDADPTPEWNRQQAYLQVEAEGFVGPYGASTTARDAERIVKAVFGLAMGLWLFRVEHAHSPWPFRMQFYVHKRTAEVWEIDNRLELDEELSRSLGGLVMETLDGALAKDEARTNWASVALAEMRAVFSGGSKAEELVLASQWFFSSCTGRDELLNFVQAIVVLEILLGEKAAQSELSLGEILRNRCAYLIGYNRQQRAELLRDFGKIYAVRSQIVHRGKRRLTAAELSLFFKLLWICRRVFQEEVKLLKADPREGL